MNSPPLSVTIAGSTGKMGRALLEALSQVPGLVLGAALEQPGSPYLGRDPGDWLGSPLNCAISADLAAALGKTQVLIDFTRPAGSLRHLDECLRQHRALVLGTTGFSTPERAWIEAASQQIPIVFSPNMSMGITLVLQLLDLAARILQPGFDVEIQETHHRHKVDAPSGTALRMGEVIAKACNLELEQTAIYGRSGHTGERATNTIGFATTRGGDVVGDHTVAFLGQGERIEISHKASSRATFALGALRAARFVVGQPPGLYDMQDVLGLKLRSAT